MSHGGSLNNSIRVSVYRIKKNIDIFSYLRDCFVKNIVNDFFFKPFP